MRMLLTVLTLSLAFACKKRDTGPTKLDISRLLGSLVGSDSMDRKQGIAAYELLRPLSGDELRLIDAYDRSSVLLSGLNCYWRSSRPGLYAYCQGKARQLLQ